jgi:hypothetical protein
MINDDKRCSTMTVIDDFTVKYSIDAIMLYTS